MPQTFRGLFTRSRRRSPHCPRLSATFSLPTSSTLPATPPSRQPASPAESTVSQSAPSPKTLRNSAYTPRQGGIDRKLFRYDDALGNALLAYYQHEISAHGMTGIQTAADIIDGYVLGLAWLDEHTAETLADIVPERGRLDDDYCRFLYRQHAERLFSAGKYTDALPVFRNIHDFRWSDVDAYLDASECFLRTGQPQECVKLLRELRAELDAKMTSRNLQRAGKLFRESGDKKAAAESLRAARKRLHEEQRKGN